MAGLLRRLRENKESSGRALREMVHFHQGFFEKGEVLTSRSSGQNSSSACALGGLMAVEHMSMWGVSKTTYTGQGPQQQVAMPQQTPSLQIGTPKV